MSDFDPNDLNWTTWIEGDELAVNAATSNGCWSCNVGTWAEDIREPDEHGRVPFSASCDKCGIVLAGYITAKVSP